MLLSTYQRTEALTTQSTASAVGAQEVNVLRSSCSLGRCWLKITRLELDPENKT